MPNFTMLCLDANLLKSYDSQMKVYTTLCTTVFKQITYTNRVTGKMYRFSSNKYSNDRCVMTYLMIIELQLVIESPFINRFVRYCTHMKDEYKVSPNVLVFGVKK
ncbi:hypothetical protein A0J61_08768 [Choanephora cucurbitarum]|uniref:Uncharacterized protein n=1 Tax=Choanephora cucurbitarum TaxID=101091 RepID=A0A1C7N777_9FUNG|nr:hypothetical protein A0J61_08768 [Choanephora cucurbitarum]